MKEHYVEIKSIAESLLRNKTELNFSVAISEVSFAILFFAVGHFLIIIIMVMTLTVCFQHAVFYKLTNQNLHLDL